MPRSSSIYNATWNLDLEADQFLYNWQSKYSFTTVAKTQTITRSVFVMAMFSDSSKTVSYQYYHAGYDIFSSGYNFMVSVCVIMVSIFNTVHLMLGMRLINSMLKI